MRIVILGREDIKKILKLEDVIDVVKGAYCQKSEGKAVIWPSIEYYFEEEKAVMDIRSGYVIGNKVHGLKMLNNFPLNSELNLPCFNGMLMVFDSRTGIPKGVLDASYITSMRTGAAAALGVKSLARQDSKNLLIIGAGLQAIYMIAVTLKVMPQLEKVRIYDPLSYNNAISFTNNIIKTLELDFLLNPERTEFTAVNDLPKTLKDTDAVITVTRAKSPIVKKEWVKSGTHFSCIGADMIGKEELDPEIFKGARIFADDKDQSIKVGEMEFPIKNGIISEQDIVGEIGDVLLNKIQGRRNREEITIFDATGLALLDLVTGNLVIESALREESGTVVEI